MSDSSSEKRGRYSTDPSRELLVHGQRNTLWEQKTYVETNRRLGISLFPGTEVGSMIEASLRRLAEQMDLQRKVNP